MMIELVISTIGNAADYQTALTMLANQPETITPDAFQQVLAVYRKYFNSDISDDCIYFFFACDAYRANCMTNFGFPELDIELITEAFRICSNADMDIESIRKYENYLSNENIAIAIRVGYARCALNKILSSPDLSGLYDDIATLSRFLQKQNPNVIENTMRTILSIQPDKGDESE